MQNTPQNKIPTWQLIRKLFVYVQPYNKMFFLTGFLTIFLGVIAPVRPWLINYTIDHYIATNNAQMLLNMTLLMIGILLVETILQYFQAYFATAVGQSVVKDLRLKLLGHIQKFKLRYFDNTPIGTLVTRVVNDIETIAEVFSEGLLVMIADILKLIIVVIVMIYTDWRLTIVSLLPIPLLILATRIFQQGIKKSFQEVRNKVAQLNVFVQEHIVGMSIVQLFNREAIEIEKFKQINHEHRKAQINTIWYYSIFLPLVEILSAISIGLLVWWGSKGVMNEQTTLGNIVAFVLYIYMLYRPIRNLADKFNVLQMGIVSAERVFKILENDEPIEPQGNQTIENIKGNIVFQNVWMAYKNEEWVLKNINLTINAGETIAIVGETGSGKTSIINLLGRFYTFQEGNIFLDGKDINQIKLSELRKNIGFVLQDVFLFSDTIFNNITLKQPDVTMDMVIHAAKKVGAHEFIMRLPKGYDFYVHERGNSLSVGQRQLISLVRTYIQDPKILILDEATASIDTESERLFQAAVSELTKNRTAIIIAHRLSTIQNADKIIVMHQGQIVEIGTHQALINKNGYYKQLHDLQFKNL